MEIRKLGDKVLTQRSKRVAKIDDTIRNLCASMIHTMMQNNGVGLAAPQVGISKQIVVALIADGLLGENPKCFINPEILTHSKETEICEEGCLSIPETFIPVERYKSITIKYRDLSGRPKVETYENLEARVLQHEIEHLNGVLMTDH